MTSLATMPGTYRLGRTPRRPGRSWQPLLLLLPALGALIAVSVFPVLQGLWQSFTDRSLIYPDSGFVWFDNYTRLVADAKFWNAWHHTITFTVVSTLLETLLGLGFALALFGSFRGRGLTRAAMLVPWAIPTVVTSKMFGWLFDGQNGVVNFLLQTFGITDGNVNFYGSVDSALWTIIVADVWKTTPFMALLILAGLQTIPRSLQDAAAIDGSGAFHYFWYVRLPLLAPTLLIAAMFRALDAFRIFDLVYVLTGGGPADSTETLSTLIYKQLFSALQIGYGSALASAMFVTEILIAVGFGIFISRRMRHAE